MTNNDILLLAYGHNGSRIKSTAAVHTCTCMDTVARVILDTVYTGHKSPQLMIWAYALYRPILKVSTLYNIERLKHTVYTYTAMVHKYFQYQYIKLYEI